MSQYPQPPGDNPPPPPGGFPPPPPPPPPGGFPPPPPPPAGYAPPPPPAYAPPPPGGYAPPPAYQQPAPSAAYGGFLLRLVAYLIDGLILGIPFFILFALVGGLAVATVSTTTIDPNTGQVTGGAATAGAAGLLVLIYLGLAVVSVLYFVFLWSRGGTIGMRLLKLHVVDATTGGNISMGKAFLRYLGLIIAAFPCYLGLLWVIWDPRKQGWHDKIAGTLVTHSA